LNALLSSHKSCNMIMYGCLKCFLIFYLRYFIIILLLFTWKVTLMILLSYLVQCNHIFLFLLKMSSMWCYMWNWVMHSKSNYDCLTTSSQFQLYIFLLVLDFLVWTLPHLLIACFWLCQPHHVHIFFNCEYQVRKEI